MSPCCHQYNMSDRTYQGKDLHKYKELDILKIQVKIFGFANATMMNIGCLNTHRIERKFPQMNIRVLDRIFNSCQLIHLVLVVAPKDHFLEKLMLNL